MEEELTPVTENGKLQYTLAAPEDKYAEQVRIYVNLQGNKKLLLTDFASCGKKWLSKHNRMTVWMNTRL